MAERNGKAARDGHPLAIMYPPIIHHKYCDGIHMHELKFADPYVSAAMITSGEIPSRDRIYGELCMGEFVRRLRGFVEDGWCFPTMLLMHFLIPKNPMTGATIRPDVDIVRYEDPSAKKDIEKMFDRSIRKYKEPLTWS